MVLHSLIAVVSTWFARAQEKVDQVDTVDGLVWERNPLEQKHLRDEAQHRIDQWYWMHRA